MAVLLPCRFANATILFHTHMQQLRTGVSAGLVDPINERAIAPTGPLNSDHLVVRQADADVWTDDDRCTDAAAAEAAGSVCIIGESILRHSRRPGTTRNRRTET